MSPKQTGMIAGAPATAPGGMSQPALVAELIEVHGWKVIETEVLTWPEMIDAVIAGRLAREDEQRCEKHETINCAECDGTAKAHDESLSDDTPDAAAMFEVVGAATYDADSDTIEDVDPDDLMAELLTTREEHEQYTAEHGLLIKSPDTLDYIFDGHAGAGPSASERWLTCTASLGASRAFLETLTPNQQAAWAKSNSAARQGTTAHAAAEVEAQVMLGNMSAEEAALTMIELAAIPEAIDEAYDVEMADYITEYTDLVKSYASERGSGNVLIEQRVTTAVPLIGSHEGEVHEIPGSADCIVLPTPEEPTLVVADLKYGNGIWVDAEENSQVRTYALGALALIVDENGQVPEWMTTVTMHIVQPRIDGIKTFTETVNQLLDWRDEVLSPQLTKALFGAAEGATFVPTETGCQFCPARGSCVALAEDRMEKAADLFDVVVEAEYADGPGAFPETTTLTDTRLGELYAQISALQSLYKDLKAEAERRMFRGETVPGLVLVNYQPPRQWEEGAEEAFDDVPELWVKKMVTPTQAVKMAEANPEEWDKDGLETWIDKPDKRPVVAREGDRRSKWEGRPPEAMFDVEGES